MHLFCVCVCVVTGGHKGQVSSWHVALSLSAYSAHSHPKVHPAYWGSAASGESHVSTVLSHQLHVTLTLDQSPFLGKSKHLPAIIAEPWKGTESAV